MQSLCILCTQMCLHIMVVGFVFLRAVQLQRTTQRLPGPFVSAALTIAGHSMPHYSEREMTTRRRLQFCGCRNLCAGRQKAAISHHKRSFCFSPNRQSGCLFLLQLPKLYSLQGCGQKVSRLCPAETFSRAPLIT